MRRFPRIQWLLGVISAWATFWLLLALRAFYMLGSNPHPFLPDLKINGIMLRALAEWGLGALAAYLSLGILFALLSFVALRLGEHPPKPGDGLGFRTGLWMGIGTVAWVHGVLFILVPGTLTTLPLLRRLPIALLFAGFLFLGLWALAQAMRQGQARWPWLRASAVAGLLSLLPFLPHDLFRRNAPAAAALPPETKRLLVLGVDGLRQDQTEAALPHWKAPGGAQPVVAVPATRLAWNMLLGGDPETLTRSFVVPYRREWRESNRLGLLVKAKAKGLHTAFLIDDSTTLSFGLSTAPFSEVKEPFGGWKHFFTAGAGFTWPAYSWLENFLSPIETTNPWAEPKFFLRDIGRALARSHWVSAHTCQLHAPFYLRARELQAHKPWSWLLASPRSFEPYQATFQAQSDQLSRAGRRADPELHYAVRVQQLLHEIEPQLAEWSREYPQLSGVFTSDHGEQHTALKGPDGRVLTHLTGTHGFSLEPDTVRVPLHPFGQTTTALGPGEVFSWFHLRDGLLAWVEGEAPLHLATPDKSGWAIQWPYIHPTHILGPVPTEAATSAVSPMDLANKTYLLDNGTWFLDDPKTPKEPRLCHALITANQMITFTPTVDGKWVRLAWQGYVLQASREVSLGELNAELLAFKGGRPQRLGSPK